MLWLAGMLVTVMLLLLLLLFEEAVAVETLLAKGPQASSSTLIRSLTLDVDEEAGLVSVAGLMENKSTS